jgi:hypothetical protein
MDSATLRRLAVAAGNRDPRTVKAYLEGKPVTSGTHASISQALADSGLTHLIRQEPTFERTPGMALTSSPKSRA